MKAVTYNVSLTGLTPLIMHFHNIEWAARMSAWQSNPQNKKKSVAGDDRSPAWRWIGNAYTDATMLGIPSDNLMTMLREGGKAVPTGVRGASFKAATQSGIIVNEPSWPLVTPKGTIRTADIMALVDEDSFDAHVEKCASMGFMLFAKPVRVGQNKHIRVRPRFDTWSASGTVTVLDERITADVLSNILTQAGAFCGLCDWRPSSPKSPGSWGKFEASLSKQ